MVHCSHEKPALLVIRRTPYGELMWAKPDDPEVVERMRTAHRQAVTARHPQQHRTECNQRLQRIATMSDPGSGRCL